MMLAVQRLSWDISSFSTKVKAQTQLSKENKAIGKKQLQAEA